MGEIKVTFEETDSDSQVTKQGVIDSVAPLTEMAERELIVRTEDDELVKTEANPNAEVYIKQDGDEDYVEQGYLQNIQPVIS